jgi:RNA polymerase sigma factor (sigma-70 family)
MLMDDCNILKALRGMIHRLSTNPHLQQDLIQECCLRLWRLQSQQPGQSASWYVQSCRFHIHHYLSRGRSVDSPKRRNAEMAISITGDRQELPVDWEPAREELIELVSVRDIMATLACRLNPREQEVLSGLAEGLTLRDIAKRLNLSYPTALRHRRRIAALTVKLGICAPRRRERLPHPSQVLPAPEVTASRAAESGRLGSRRSSAANRW